MEVLMSIELFIQLSDRNQSLALSLTLNPQTKHGKQIIVNKNR